MRTELLERRLNEWVDQGLLPGAVFALANRSEIVSCQAFGLARTAPEPEVMATDHRFVLTSITKTMIAAQAMRLVEQGKLALDAPMVDYVPEFGSNGKDTVTTWNILTHSSGVDQAANTAERLSPGFSPTDHLRAAIDARLTFHPGERFEYCSPTFWVLAEAITRLAGVDYTVDFVDSVARPAGMLATRHDVAPIPEHFVPSFGARDSRVADQGRLVAYPAGGLVSTAEDVARFGQIFLNGGLSAIGERVLSPASVEAMIRSQTAGLPGHAIGESRGIGFEIGGPGTLRSPRTFGHGGASGTHLWVDPTRDLVAVFLSAHWSLARRIHSSFIDLVVANWGP